MEERPYRASLERLERVAAALPRTTMNATARVLGLVGMNMRWERRMVDPELPEHPWPLAAGIVDDAVRQLEAWSEIGFIAGESSRLPEPAAAMESRHRELFQELWVNFSEEGYAERIERFAYRLEINGLAEGMLAGLRCIDFGCGHGNFAHALLLTGASHVYGIDYGENSIRYAQAARDRLGVSPERLVFEVGSVYEVPRPDRSFDFAVQNGVFHHLDDEDRAYRELHRVLAAGGWAWIYTDGSGAVSHDLWDASVRILADVPDAFVLEVLDLLGVEPNKRYHLGDGLNATYRHTSWQELTERLERLGFGEFRRLRGGFPTDFDHDVIASHRWGPEKFGEGDLRLLARKTR